MSAAEGVPLTRELLEALVEAAGMQSDMALPNVNLANVWYAVKQKCAAALASGAGAPEGRPVRPHRSGCGHLDCGELQPIPGFAFPPPGIVDAIREFQARDTAAPLDESGAAAPDAELDSLLTLLCGYEYDRGVADYVGDAGAVRDHTSSAVDTIAAIHAHVAQVKREAHDIGFRRGLRELPPDLRRPPEDDELPRAVDMMAAMDAPAPAPGAASGDFTVGDPRLAGLLYQLADQWLNVGRNPEGAEAGGYDYSARMVTLGAIQRLYRAATGEVSEGVRLIAAERRRQISVEGWTPEHDDQHTNGELAKAAACYTLDGTTARAYDMEKPTAWPWEQAWWKPGSYQRNLEKAGALIAAEIERLLRRDKEGV